MTTENGGIVLSTNEREIGEDLNVFSNPTSKLLTILSPQNKLIESLKIYDVNGRLVKELKPNAVSATIDFADLEANIYYLEIHSGEGIRVKKIVKK